MSKPKPKHGALEFKAEGYLIRWGGRGLEIQVTEYHATRLLLTWDQLFELARKSGWKPRK